MPDVVNGFFGDFVDFVSMACTTFGVCTSLGFGVDVIMNGLRRLDCGRGATCVSDIPTDDGSVESKNWKVRLTHGSRECMRITAYGALTNSVCKGTHWSMVLRPGYTT